MVSNETIKFRDRQREREGGNKDFNKEFLHLPKIPTILGLALVQGPRERKKKKERYREQY